MYGFAFGSLLGVALWWTKAVTPFPLLLLGQTACLAGFAFVPFLKHLCIALLPARILHHHAARRAVEEFVFVSRHVPNERPVVLLYVSLAERYAHILHSRAVPQKVPASAWDAIIATFTGRMKTGGLKDACIPAIAEIGKTLSPHFPDKGEENALGDGVIERP
jgi:putative membrane protein